ncbi:hypothetical protein ACFYOI_14875 [Streptomyces microflavus]|uniref:hypothetical protein n=1 Tax=Streptomyces microflavus TaxID=1919 RepID=UPI0033ADA470
MSPDVVVDRDVWHGPAARPVVRVTLFTLLGLASRAGSPLERVPTSEVIGLGT